MTKRISQCYENDYDYDFVLESPTFNEEEENKKKVSDENILEYFEDSSDKTQENN